MPFPTEDEDESEDEEDGTGAAAQQQRLAAQTQIQDFTRNIQRKKEKETGGIAVCGGGDASGGSKQVIQGEKVGRNDPCPCGSGKKYKKCHGA